MLPLTRPTFPACNRRSRSAICACLALLALFTGACSSGTTDASGAAAVGGTGGAGADGSGGGSTGGASGSGAGGLDSGETGDNSGSAGTGGATGGSGGGGGSGGTGADGAVVLNQAGNPVYALLDTYKSWLSTASGDTAKLAADRQLADNMLSWQLPHGGFYKNGVSVYAAAWNGSDSRSGWIGAGGVELGTIDNDATVTELLFLADVYRRSGDTKYRDGARRALDFLLTMQYPNGGFPQVYPARTVTTYSNYVTFNDDAMARVLVLLHELVRQAPPLDDSLSTSAQRAEAHTAIAKGVEYILAAQIVQSGVKTVWCAQHDPVTYEPRGGRSYELASKSGKESVGVVTFLMTQPQTAEVKAAAQAAIAWYASDAVELENTAYVSRPAGSTDDSYNPIQPRAGSTMWCRFYDLGQDVCFFSGRLPTDNPPGMGKQYDIMAIEPERRYGYEWGGSYGSKLFAYAASIGY